MNILIRTYFWVDCMQYYLFIATTVMNGIEKDSRIAYRKQVASRSYIMYGCKERKRKLP